MIDKKNNLNGEKHFYSGMLPNYLVFIPVKKYVKYFSSTKIFWWNVRKKY